MSTTEQDLPTADEAPQVTDTPPVEKPTFKMNALVDEDGVRAFIRLPNQFQFDEIRRKALAAKARRVRQLHDPESDSFVILDEEMDRLRREGDVEKLVEEVVAKDWWRDHLEAVKDTREEERFAHVEDDEARYTALRALDAAKRPAEEYAELERTIEAYDKAVTESREERQRPRKEALRALDMDELVERIRDLRVADEADKVFNLTFSKHQMAACTLTVDDKGKPTRTRYFDNVEGVENADPTTIDILSYSFNQLEQQFGRGLEGNS